MRKRILGPYHAQQGDQSDKGWLDLEQIATVEVTSEDPSFPLKMHSGQTMDRASALLKVGNSKSALSSINLCRCIG